MTNRQRVYVASMWAAGVLRECNMASQTDNMTDSDMEAILKMIDRIANSISEDYNPDLRCIVDVAKTTL